MNKTILLILVLIVLLVTSGLLTNAIIHQQSVSKSRSNQFPQPTTSKLRFNELTQLIGTTDAESLAYLAGVRDLKTLFRDDEQVHINEQKSLVINNQTNDYQGYDSKPIALYSPFRILLNFSGQNDDTAFILSGLLNSPGNEWWQGIREMRISYNNEEQKFVLDLRDGKDLDKVEYIGFCSNCLPTDTLIFNFLDPQGKNLVITDSSGEVVKQIQLTKLEKADFPDGLFPFYQLFVGYSISPQSQLKINNLLFSE